MRSLARLGLALVLLGGLFAMCVHVGTPADRGPYPEDRELATDYDAYVGEDTLLFGSVRDVDPGADRAVIFVESPEGDFEMTVERFAATVQRGGVVQVYGVLAADHTIDARNVEVVNPAGGSNGYKYGVSAVGAVLVLVAFFRTWRFDPKSLAFEVRSDG